MKIFTRAELSELRELVAREPDVLMRSPETVEHLIRQAEYGLECARLLDEAVHYPAEPYGEAEVLVARLTDGMNDIWNRHHYRENPETPAK